MNRMYRVPLMCAAIALLPCLAGSAFAQDDDASAADLNAEIKALRQEVAVLSSALLKLQTTVDAQFKKVLGEVAKVASAKKPASRKPDTKIYDVKVGDSPYFGAKDAAVTIVDLCKSRAGQARQ